MAFKTENSTLDGKMIEVANRVETRIEGHTFEAILPSVAYFDGRKRTKSIKGEPIDLGLPEVRLYLEELPPQSIARIFEYGFAQYMADAVASATDAPEAQAKLRTRVELLVSGELTTRRTNTPKRAAAGNPDYPIISKLFAKQLLELTKKNYGGDRPANKDKEALAKWDAAQVDALKLLANLPKVQKTVAEERKRMEELAAAIDEDNILGDLLGDEDEMEGGEEEKEGEDSEEGDDTEGEGETEGAGESENEQAA